MQVLRQIDFVGGFLSVSGMLLFMAAPLLLGAALLAAFFVWEWKFAKYPMFPARLKQNPRILILTLIITFISGANFFSVLLFWPTQAFNVYGQDPIGVGIRGLPIGFSILAGAFIVLWLLSVFRGHNRELMIASSILMTAGTGALACARDLIATVAALTLAIRVIGGSIGYTTYYNVFINKFTPNAIHHIGGAMALQLNITSPLIIKQAIQLTGASLLEELHSLPGIRGNARAYEIVVRAGQVAFAESYRWVYLVSIAFGGVSILASLFLGNIDQYMDDHVAVVM
ncbi:MAG: hypothetical protein Q9212_005726, partial [Teloschistes hypoglaucus]